MSATSGAFDSTTREQLPPEVVRETELARARAAASLESALRWVRGLGLLVVVALLLTPENSRGNWSPWAPPPGSAC